MLIAPSCGNRAVLVTTLCSPLRAAHVRSLAQSCRGISCSAARLVAPAIDGFGLSMFGFSRERIATLVYSVVACLMKMQRRGRLSYVATAPARRRLSERQRAPSSYGAPRQLSRPGAGHVSVSRSSSLSIDSRAGRGAGFDGVVGGAGGTARGSSPNTRH